MDEHPERKDRQGPAYPPVRWFYLALGGVTMLCIGSIYGWSVLKVPMAQEFGWGASALSMAYSLASCVFCLCSILGSWLQKRLGLRPMLVIGAAAIFAGYGSVTLFHSGGIALLYLCFGPLVGGGIGLTYPVLLGWIGGWFPDKRGLCSGVLTMGFGCSALLLVRPAAELFHVPGVGWRGTYLLLGTCALVSLLLCALFFRGSPQSGSAGEGGTGEGWSAKRALRHPSYWAFYVYMTFNSVLGTVMMALAYDYCVSLDMNASLAATMVGVISAFNGASRVLFGLLYDKLGRKRTMLIGSAAIVLAAACLLAAVPLRTQLLAAAGLVLVGLGFGYANVMSPAVMREFFGGRDFAILYSFGNTRTFLTSMLTPVLTMVLTATGSFVAPLTVTLATSCAAFALQRKIKAPE